MNKNYIFKLFTAITAMIFCLAITLQAQNYTITTVAKPAAGGSITGSGSYVSGSDVTLTATAAGGYKFCSWIDDTTDNPRSVTVTQDSTFTALFCKLPTATLAADETTLCEGSSTTFTATVANTDSIFWYADGAELTAERGKTSITVSPKATATYKLKAMNTDTIYYKGAAATTSQIAVGDIVTTDHLLVKPADWSKLAAAGKIALGVVYHVSDTLTRIVMLSENADVPWGFYGTDIPGVTNHNDANSASNDFSGYTNTAAILAYKTSSGTNLNASQCAAVWAAEQGGYLPAAGELKAVMNNRTTVNQTLYAISGTELSFVWYWSSFEYSNNKAWLVKLNGEVGHIDKYDTRRARAVVALSTVYLFNNLTISCEAEAEQTVYVGTLPTATLAADETAYCEGGSTTFTATVANTDSIFWYADGAELTAERGKTSITVSPKATATYKLKAMNTDTIYYKGAAATTSQIAVGDIVTTDHLLVKPADWSKLAAAGKIALGVVYHVSDTLTRIVMLSENADVPWGFYGTDIPGIQETTDVNVATVDYSGAAHTDSIIAYNNRQATPLTASECAAVWAAEQGGYLPAAGELKTVIDNRGTINTTLSTTSGTRISDYNWFWSSSEFSYSYAWLVKLNGEVGHIDKYDTRRARAVVALSTVYLFNNLTISCEAEAEQTVYVGTLPTISLAADETTLCEGSSTTLTATVTNTDSIFWYADGTELIAERGKTNITVSPTATATYKVKTMNTDTVSDVFVKGAAATTSQIAVGNIITTDSLLVKPADWTIVSAAPYNKTALGVVYHVSDTLTRIVMLSENASVPWGFNVTDIPGVPSYTQAAAEADFSGQSNTAAILAYNTSSGTNLNTSQCAAVWAAGQDGYLPACGELKTVMNNINTVNNTLYTISGTQISNDRFWSSSEYFSEFAWSVYYSGLVYFGTKGGSRRARAVVALSTVYLFNNLTISCEAEAEQTITVHPVFDMPTVVDTVCFAENYTEYGWSINTADSIADTYLYERKEQTIHGCDSIVNLQLTIIPEVIVNPTYDITVCNGASISTTFTTSTIGNGTMTYAWTNDNTSIGLAASGEGDIASFPATNTGTAPDTAVIVVTPNYILGTVPCVGDADTFMIIVNPTAVVNAIDNQTLCNGSNTDAVIFGTTNTGGTMRYTWTNDTPSIGLAASGEGDIASFAAANTGTAPVTATITVTPYFTYNGVECSGEAKSFTITVNQTAVVNAIDNQTLCNGSETSVTFMTPNTGGTMRYTWTNDTPSIGLAASGEGDITSFAAANTGTAPVTATITVTPYFTYNGVECSGEAKSFTITVNPTAVVNAIDNQTLCNGSNTAAVTFGTTNTGGTMRYTWTNDTPSIGLAASGEGDIASFAAANTGTAPVTATIKVTPYFTYNGVECSGEAKSFTITVNPTAVVNAIDNQTLCNGSNTAAVTFGTTNTVGTMRYAWTNDNTSIGLAASGEGDIASFTATNTGTAPVTATITVTPYFTYNGVECSGEAKSFTITVNPTAVVNAIDNQTLCNGSNTAAVTFGTTNTGGTMRYTWTNDTPSIGLAASGEGDITSFTATNTGIAPVTATITVTPYFTYNGVECSGEVKSFTITVNPTAVVNAIDNQTLCNGSETSVTFMTPNTGGTMRYTWTNDTPSIGLAASGEGNIASFTATNTGTAPVTATITVTLYFTYNGVECSGEAKSFTITVNPTAVVNAIDNQTLCNGSNTAAVTFGTTNTGGTMRYTWTNDTPSIGLAASGEGYITSFTATNTGIAPVTATITVTPYFTYNGVECSGEAKSFTITVNPTAVVNAIDNQTLCNGSNTAAVTFGTTNTVGTMRYAWTNDNTSIGLAASGEGDIASFTATNTGTAPVTATITVTPYFTYNGVECSGEAKSFTITVNPTAVVNAIDNQTLCNGSNTAAVTFGTTNTGGTMRYTWTNDTPSIGLAASGEGDITSFTATNTGIAPVTATITVTPYFTYNGVECSGEVKSFTITVNPTAVVNAIDNQTLCNGSETSVTFMTPNTGGTMRYTWTNDTPSIGLAASGEGNIASFTATNTGTAPVTATITVTLYFTYNGVECSGEAKSFTITVNPTAVVNAIDNQTLCNGSNTAAVTFGTTNTGGTMRYTWTNDTPSIGLAASGEGYITSFTATNTGIAPVTATITVTPYFTYNGVECSGEVKSFTITVNYNPVITASVVTTASCSTGEDGVATVTVLNGVSEYSYLWNTNPVQTTQTAVNLPVGMHSVTVTDANGCSTTTTVEMTVQHLPASNLTASIYDYTTVQLSWTASESPYVNAYNVYRDGQLYTTVPTTYFDDLEQNYATEYCYYIKAVCGDNEESEPTETVCINTYENPCDDGPKPLPFSESFEGLFPTRCWTVRYVDENNVNGMSHSTQYAYEGNKSFRFASFNQANNYEEYLITPEIADDEAMKVSFRYKMYALSNREAFKVGYSLTGNEIEDFIWGETVKNATTLWQLYERYVPAGTKYVAIQYCSNFSWYLYVDDFKLEAATIPEYTINVTAEPVEGATVSGGGTYSLYDTATITATVTAGYNFNGWLENGNVVSTDLSYSFEVTADRNFVAATDMTHYRVYLNASPSNGGSVSGYGRYEYGETITIGATPAEGYWFEAWRNASNGSIFAETAAYSFDIYETVNLIANFRPTHVYTYFDATICEGTAYSDNGFEIPNPIVGTNIYEQTYQFANYDSTAVLTLTVNPTYNIVNNVSICETELPYYYAPADTTFEVGTPSLSIIQYPLFTINGCDSIVTLNLTVNPTYATTVEISACDEYIWNNETYTQSGEYIQQLETVNGCDSVVTLHLTINNSVTYEFDVTACDSYTWNNVTYTASDDYVQNFTTVNDCDSTVTLHLTINNSVTYEFDVIACDSYTWNDVTYTASDDYVQNFTTVNDCDSTVTLHLTINNSVSSEFEATACDSYTWNNVTYTESDDYVQSFTTVNGCDSTVTLHLTINNSVTYEFEATACDSYTWNNVTYTESGDYVQSFTTVNGCDSTVTLHLTINNSVTYEFEATACDSYTWNNVTYTVSDNYTQQFETVNGCDSTVTLQLTINQSVAEHVEATACDSYTWNNETYTESGNYTQQFETVNGCDSTVTLQLTVNSSYEVTEQLTICDTALPYYYAPADTTFKVGTPSLSIIHYPLSTINGCDSVITLYLTIESCGSDLETQIIPINRGWNNISTYLAVNDTITFGDVFENSGIDWIIDPTFTTGIVMIQNPYVNPAVNLIVGVSSSTTLWVNKIAYSLYSCEAGLSLTINGLPYEEPQVDVTSGGWGFVPVLSKNGANISDILNNINGLTADDFIYISSLTSSFMYASGMVVSSSLESLEPGLAYDIYSTKSFTIDYAAYGNKSINPNEDYIPLTPWATVAANPNYCMIFAEAKTMATMSDYISVGDVVAAFNGNGLCVGQGYYSGEEGLSVKVYGDDVMTEAVDGMLSGESISFKIYRPATGEISDVNFEWSSEKAMYGDATYISKGFSNIKGIKSITGIEDYNNLNVSIYPNPTSGEVNVTANANIKSISVHNSVGALVETMCTSSLQQTTTIDISRYASGVYMLTITTVDGSKVIKKVVKR